MRIWWWCIPLCLLAAPTGGRAQEDAGPAIKPLLNPDGAALHSLWFFVNRVGFRFQSESDLNRRLDENQEEEILLQYDEDGVRKQLQVTVRIALENGPPVSPTMTKEHEIRGLTVWMEIAQDDEEVASFKRRAEDFVVTKKQSVTATMEPFTFRNVLFSPSVQYDALRDLAGPAYYVRMEGLSFTLTYED
jgi:hypothetical protein